jgi:hypothetical protein
MNRLIALFRAITEPSKKSVRGIWAELFLINQSSNPELLVRSWRAAPDDQFDFSYGGQRIEVKSSAGRRRVHHFSHEQLHPPQGAQVIVVSLFVERAGAGTSVGELTQSVRDLVAGDAALISHVDQVVFETLGQAWNNALSERFDSQLASQSLSAFSADLIPRFPRELPTGLTDVHFQADLTGIASLEQEMLHSAGGLFAAINPIQ